MHGYRLRFAATALGLCCLGAVEAGCAPRATEARFDSPNPAAKLYAIHQAGQQRDASNIPPLIEQLNSDDPAVRMYAILALEKITDTRLNYSPYDPPWQRKTAIDRWVAAYHSGRFATGKRSSDASDQADERHEDASPEAESMADVDTEADADAANAETRRE